MGESSIASEKFPLEGPDTSGVEVSRLAREVKVEMTDQIMQAENIQDAEDLLYRYINAGKISEEMTLGKVLKTLSEEKEVLIDDDQKPAEEGDIPPA